MKKLILILFFLPLSLFGQLHLGDIVSYTSDDIEFIIKKPLPFEESNNAFGADKATLVRSFFNKENLVVIQIHSNPILKEFQNDMNKLMEDFEMARNIFARTRGPINEIVSFERIVINNRPFYELTYIKNHVEKQMAWITVHKNHLININNSTTISNFDSIEWFLNDFKKHIEIR